MSLALPFVIAVLVPYATGERLADSSDFQVALEMYRSQPGTRSLDPEAAIQAWILQQFLVLLVLSPVSAAMSIAAYSVIGEKQARTLEPLLATPISTFELLAAKVLGGLVPAVALSLVCFAIYVGAAASLARPGVASILFAPRSLAIVFVLGPLAALAALQLAVVVSSRVNDARSAQQIGALIILPIAALLVAQVVGWVQLTMPVIRGIAAGLAAVDVMLMSLGVRLFDRESILTRWR
jgi:ABC-2 type transport system permease protein